MKKRILAVLLTVAMLLSVVNGINFTAFATTENGFTYTVKNNEATITDYTGSETDLKIPNTLGGYPVTIIGESAFDYSSLKSVELCENITTVESSAFVCSEKLVSARFMTM